MKTISTLTTGLALFLGALSGQARVFFDVDYQFTYDSVSDPYVILYQYPDYLGESIVIYPGHEYSELPYTIGSVQVVGNVHAVLFDQPGFWGHQLTVHHNIPDLRYVRMEHDRHGSFHWLNRVESAYVSYSNPNVDVRLILSSHPVDYCYYSSPQVRIFYRRPTGVINYRYVSPVHRVYRHSFHCLEPRYHYGYSYPSRYPYTRPPYYHRPPSSSRPPSTRPPGVPPTPAPVYSRPPSSRPPMASPPPAPGSRPPNTSQPPSSRPPSNPPNVGNRPPSDSPPSNRPGVTPPPAPPSQPPGAATSSPSSPRLSPPSSSPPSRPAPRVISKPSSTPKTPPSIKPTYSPPQRSTVKPSASKPSPPTRTVSPTRSSSSRPSAPPPSRVSPSSTRPSTPPPSRPSGGGSPRPAPPSRR